MVEDAFLSDAGAYLFVGSALLVGMLLLRFFWWTFDLLLIVLLLGTGVCFFGAGVALVLSARKPKKPAIEKQEAKPSLATPHWAEREIGKRYAVWLARLEELKASSKIDERVYQRLREEYERKLREAIEVPT